MRRLRVYIAGPLSQGDLAENINLATSVFHAIAANGLAPLCPHWSAFSGGIAGEIGDRPFAYAYTRPRDTTHEYWMAVDLPWVEASDAVLRLPGASDGADLEVSHARKHGVPVFYSAAEVVEWSNGLLAAKNRAAAL